MNHYTQAEREFARQILARVRRIVRDKELPVSRKLNRLQLMMQKQSHRAAMLRELEERTTSKARQERCERLKALRLRTVRYLSQVAAYVAHKDKHKLSLRQGPIFFTESPWEAEASKLARKN